MPRHQYLHLIFLTLNLRESFYYLKIKIIKLSIPIPREHYGICYKVNQINAQIKVKVVI